MADGISLLRLTLWTMGVTVLSLAIRGLQSMKTFVGFSGDFSYEGFAKVGKNSKRIKKNNSLQ